MTIDELRAEVDRLRERWARVQEWDWETGMIARDAYRDAVDRLAEEEQKAKEEANT